MKVLIVLAILVVVSTAQFDWLKRFFRKRITVLDNVHNYRFEEHKLKKQKLLVAISDLRSEKECHIIEIDNDFHNHLKDKEYKNLVSEDIYDLIHDHKQNETKSSSRALSKNTRTGHLVRTQKLCDDLHPRLCIHYPYSDDDVNLKELYIDWTMTIEMRKKANVLLKES